MDSPFEHALGEITEDDAGKETAATAFETQEDFEREYDGLNFARQEKRRNSFGYGSRDRWLRSGNQKARIGLEACH
jgi:hypothetical protein